jgi:hypothetical protein
MGDLPPAPRLELPPQKNPDGDFLIGDGQYCSALWICPARLEPEFCHARINSLLTKSRLNDAPRLCEMLHRNFFCGEVERNKAELVWTQGE